MAGLRSVSPHKGRGIARRWEAETAQIRADRPDLAGKGVQAAAFGGGGGGVWRRWLRRTRPPDSRWIWRGQVLAHFPPHLLWDGDGGADATAAGSGGGSILWMRWLRAPVTEGVAGGGRRNSAEALETEAEAATAAEGQEVRG